MKHMVRNDELLEKLGLTETHPNMIIYSCEFDDGTKAQNGDVLRLGADGMEIWFFPCVSCIQQMQSYSLQPLLVDAARSAVKSVGKEKYADDFRRIIYRGIVLVPYPDYEVPPENSEEWKGLLQTMDRYIDKGTPMKLNGLEVKQLAEAKHG